ncbi:tuberculostearic acid methyltransferase UfaA1 [Flexivirga endophytica]|uniref:Tuberculostearic acid methyltransferase UfaA1 n=1 Tax=Flexivirga endophytica TaxID=1849103 RepID=A0A916TIH4_9MICO|nr:cyclopropane-fatty-acyl-phospholipid synthase family protein [Flexivirga endophytica]GGB45595.1 tuberculostearic acid methyltransferase UfaA1 [Flexivirga endophytica]GHB66427.1 tuberculostearic acid methyltransferase UfaA1 [Flexivirga endophytica]
MTLFRTAPGATRARAFPLLSARATAQRTHSTPAIDAERWPDVARVPEGLLAALVAKIGARIFRRAVARLRIRVLMPDGAVFGGDRRADAPTIVVHDADALMRRIGHDRLIGFGESYLAGDWDSNDLASVIEQFARGVEGLVPAPLRALRSVVLPPQPSAERPARENSRSNVERHYDLSNDLFAGFLDETMTYSAALFAEGDDLATAQRRKMDRLLDQAGVTAGTAVLEIGSGWGGLALRAGRRGATVDSVTLSEQQQRWANDLLHRSGVADRAQVSLRDYRDVRGSYDAVLSVEMIEAVGLDFLETYFRQIADVLRPGGRAAVQAIVMPHHRALRTHRNYTWIHKYVFPGGAIPSLQLIEETAGRSGLRVVADLAMGDSYARTLDQWAVRFHENRSRLGEFGFDETFRRMWEFYLRYSEGGFRAGYLDVHQLTFVRESAA